MTTWTGRATVYSVTAALIDVTPLGKVPGTEHAHGRITIRARGEGIDLELPHIAYDIAVGDVIEYQIRTKGDTYVPPPAPPVIKPSTPTRRRWRHR